MVQLCYWINVHSFRSFKVYSFSKDCSSHEKRGLHWEGGEIQTYFFFRWLFKLKNVHTCESFLRVSDCFTEIEEKLENALRKGDFDAINQRVTPKTLASCKTNTLIKSFQVGLVTLSLQSLLRAVSPDQVTKVILIYFDFVSFLHMISSSCAYRSLY